MAQVTEKVNPPEIGSLHSRIEIDLTAFSTQELKNALTMLEKRPESPQIISISEFSDQNFECIKGLVEAER